MSEAFTHFEPDETPRRQADVDYSMIAHKTSRMADDITLIKRALEHRLSEEEARWVKLAIEKESQSIALRKAIIEKSLTGLIWMLIVSFGYAVKEWAIAHGFKP